MSAYLEHANLTVPDIDEAIEFLKTIEPEFYVRHDHLDQERHRWTHFGNERFYIALQEPERGSEPEQPRRTYLNFGINHLGWVVEDFDAVIERLDRAGYRRGLLVEPHYARKRAYYFDRAGFEWEIIQYLTDKDSERNSYEDE